MATGDKKWSFEEVEILKSEYPAGGVTAVQLFLPHRSEASIRSRASKLNIRRNPDLTDNPIRAQRPTELKAALLAFRLADEDCRKASAVRSKALRDVCLIRSSQVIDNNHQRRVS